MLTIITDAAAASAAEVPTRMRAPERQCEHGTALEVRGDGEFELCPAAQTDDSPPLCFFVQVCKALSRHCHVNEIRLAEDVAEKIVEGATRCLGIKQISFAIAASVNRTINAGVLLCMDC